MQNGEREKKDLEKIKARERSTRAAIEQGDVEVPIVGQFTMAQLGLRMVMADDWGRLWRNDGDKLTRIYKPGAK